MKRVAAAAAAFVVAGIAFGGAAEAQCMWNGYAWSCAPAPYLTQGYAGENDPAFGYYRGQLTGPYAEYGAGSHMGPNPGGGFYHMGSKHGRVD